MKLQRRIDREFQEINEVLKRWEYDGTDCLEAEKEIRKRFEQIFNQQCVLDKKKSHLKKENDEKINLYSSKIEMLFKAVFSDYKEKYPINVEYEDLVKKYKDLNTFFVLGISGIINKEKILEKIYHSEFEKRIPNHPKDEYPLARSIRRKFFIHAGPTNSGKTYESLEMLKKRKTGIYLSPLRLLAIEVFEKLNINCVPCTLKTGEEEIQVPFSNHLSTTIEKADLDNFYDLAVIDEGQLIGDPSRGSSWTRAILGLFAKEVHICCSLNAVSVIRKLIIDCGDEVKVIKHHRNTTLEFEKESFVFPNDVKQGDALIVFSRNKALQVASILNEINIKTSVIYGNLPPATRRKQVKQFIEGETKVVVSTDVIGMGINLPIKRIVFLETQKFDGNSQRDLLDQEIKQISGRAGRQGLYPQGFVNSIDNKIKINDQLNKKDELISSLYIMPNKETVLSINIGTLKERLMYWLTYKSKISYIEKADLNDQLFLIDAIDESLIGMFSEDQLYKAIHIPFDYENEELVAMWNSYLKETISLKTQYSPPHIMLNGELDELEISYRKIDLYYSFSKTFNKKVDEEWIDQNRRNLSEKIHTKLIEEITNK